MEKLDGEKTKWLRGVQSTVWNTALIWMLTIAHQNLLEVFELWMMKDVKNQLEGEDNQL